MNKFVLAFLILSVFSSSIFAVEGLDFGVAVLTTKTESDGKYEPSGVLIANYNGFDLELSESLELNLVPTSLEIALGDGEKMKVYTDLATLQYYGEEDFYILVTGLSLDYVDYNNFAVRENQKVSMVDLNVGKYISLGPIELDVSARLGLGGYAQSEDYIDGVTTDVRGKNFYTTEVSLGGNVEVLDGVEVYGYAGAYKQKNEKFNERGTYIGAEIPFKSVKNTTMNFFVEYDRIDRNYVLEDEGLGRNKDNLLRMGIRLDF